MTRHFIQKLRQFRHQEDGQVLIPTILWIPVFLMLIVSTIELGTLTVRHTVLERALDQTVRELRIGHTKVTAAEMKTSLCNRAKILPNCEANLRLELVSLDMRDWSAPPSNAKCVNTSTDAITPSNEFQQGGHHEMMFMRACFKYKPLTPAGGLGAAVKKDAQGYTALVSASAFVHEPK